MDEIIISSHQNSTYVIQLNSTCIIKVRTHAVVLVDNEPLLVGITQLHLRLHPSYNWVKPVPSVSLWNTSTPYVLTTVLIDWLIGLIAIYDKLQTCWYITAGDFRSYNWWNCQFVHLPLDKMAVISQATFSNAFSLNEIVRILIEISLKYVPESPINNNTAFV